MYLTTRGSYQPLSLTWLRRFIESLDIQTNSLLSITTASDHPSKEEKEETTPTEELYNQYKFRYND